MGRPLRYVPPYSLVEVTINILQGRLLLRPCDELNAIILGAIGRAQRKYQIEIHYFVYLSSHAHLLVTPPNAEALAKFMGYVNSKIAKEIGRLYGFREKIWGDRYHSILVSDETAAQVGRLRYCLENGCKENLVWKPGDWPGVHAVDAILEGKPLTGIWYDRTLQFASKQRGDEKLFPSEETVTLTPLPAWKHLDPLEYRRRVREIIDEIERETAERHRKADTEPLGVKRILRAKPHKRPKKRKKSPMPRAHAASKKMRKAMREAYQSFVVAYRHAADRLRAGDRDVEFPENSFPPRLPFVHELESFAPG